jgi:hypothetical protein
MPYLPLDRLINADRNGGNGNAAMPKKKGD